MNAAFLTVLHSLIGSAPRIYRGFRVSVTLIDNNDFYEDLKLSVNNFTQNTTLSNQYTNITCKLSNELLITVSERIISASMLLEISYLDDGGDEFIVISDLLDIADYRVDEGVTTNSISFTSNDFKIDARGSDYFLSTYSNKLKRAIDTLVEYSYMIDPLIYRHVGIGKLITTPSEVVSIVSKSLTITGDGATLTITGEEI